MAIDTPERRRNISALLQLFAPGVTPDAAQPATWRQAAGFGYIGIPVEEPRLLSIISSTEDLQLPINCQMEGLEQGQLTDGRHLGLKGMRDRDAMRNAGRS